MEIGDTPGISFYKIGPSCFTIRVATFDVLGFCRTCQDHPVMASAYSLPREPLISLRHKLAAQAYGYGRQRTYYKSENVFVYSFLQGQKSDGHWKAVPQSVPWLGNTLKSPWPHQRSCKSLCDGCRSLAAHWISMGSFKNRAAHAPPQKLLCNWARKKPAYWDFLKAPKWLPCIENLHLCSTKGLVMKSHGSWKAHLSLSRWQNCLLDSLGQVCALPSLHP